MATNLLGEVQKKRGMRYKGWPGAQGNILSEEEKIAKQVRI